jgi:hypothetical protein
MIYDRAFSNHSRIWQREITEMEHDVAMEDYTDADTYTASLVSPATQNDTPAPLPLVAAPADEALTAAYAHHPQRDRPLAGRETVGALSGYALAMMGLEGVCE